MIHIKDIYSSNNLNEVIVYINENSQFPEFNKNLPVSEISFLIPPDKILKVIENSLVTMSEIDLISLLKTIDSDYKGLFINIALPQNNISKIKYLDSDNNMLIGREEELKLLNIFLNREYKNNVILIGEPGVGKTALIKEYSSYSKKKIKEINLSEILADTKYRGEFEKKLMKIINSSIEDECILFIDEIHTLIQTGGVEGSLSASDILKPFLTDKSFQLIGATTTSESMYFENDKALERRFNFLEISELPRQVLYEIFYKELVKFSSIPEDCITEIFETVIDSLNRSLPQRNYPDKMLDFLDFYNSYVRLYGKSEVKQVLNYFELIMKKRGVKV
ncbi:TPA: ATP-dependent Clp protease ATP-binding subunit [Streptococcus suis]|nr:ATP-dependent Clp protease ATP-binding subunit [Streptococcus suis]